ncbi:hypothetical protein AAHA92_33779 [Salvia divinorum]|uniref:Uncharacterized protein n=1 Tax=Salvia divinorum TaxID=28513 RepID=A0ABD1FGU7_SALDI
MSAGGGFHRGLLEGCISGRDMSIQRRPYHKNCKCALHKDKVKERGGHSSPPNNVSYPIRRKWSHNCLNVSSSPDITTTRMHLLLYKHIDDDEEEVD